MHPFTPADSLHRLIKQAIDSGEADSIEAAERVFADYRVTLIIDGEDVENVAHQAALLTAVVLAVRVFLGGVEVVGALDVPLRVPVVAAPMLAAALRSLGATTAATTTAGRPRIAIGGSTRPRTHDFDVRTSFAGWRGGIVPCGVDAPADRDATPLAAMLAAAFAVSEAFAFVRGEGSAPGRRHVGLSLWRPDEDWLTETASDEPPLSLLPSSVWLIGLGHLGQAYLWALGLLPYANSHHLHVLLQDVDVITPSTESTSVLTDASRLGDKKTRAMATWAETRGFTTTICERRFDGSTARRHDEPALALCGVDNALARRTLDTAGFELVVEAGLGRGYDDFRALRVHVLPGARPAAELWHDGAAPSPRIDAAAYRNLAASGMDQCGVTLLAGKAVGAPFVGAVAACLVLAEVLRLLHGGVLHQVIDLDISAIEHRSVVRHTRDFRDVNPGFVAAATEQR